MKIIVAGSRHITNQNIVFMILDDARAKLSKNKTPITEIICGEAKGVDILGSQWAKSKSIPVVSFPAEWDKHGKKAGPIRNKQMGDYADSLIAIWDGESFGTKNMIDIMKKMNKPHRVFILPDEMLNNNKYSI